MYAQSSYYNGSRGPKSGENEREIKRTSACIPHAPRAAPNKSLLFPPVYYAVYLITLHRNLHSHHLPCHSAVRGTNHQPYSLRDDANRLPPHIYLFEAIIVPPTTFPIRLRPPPVFRPFIRRQHWTIALSKKSSSNASCRMSSPSLQLAVLACPPGKSPLRRPRDIFAPEIFAYYKNVSSHVNPYLPVRVAGISARPISDDDLNACPPTQSNIPRRLASRIKCHLLLASWYVRQTNILRRRQRLSSNVIERSKTSRRMSIPISPFGSPVCPLGKSPPTAATLFLLRNRTFRDVSRRVSNAISR